MEKIWTTKFLPPSIEERTELSFSALKIISYLQNSHNYIFPSGLIDKSHVHQSEIIYTSVEDPPHKTLNNKFLEQISPTLDHNPSNHYIDSCSGKFKIIPDNHLSINEGASCHFQTVQRLDSSIDMFDDDSNQIKNIDMEYDHEHSSKKIIGSINSLDEVINKKFIETKKKITHYFPIRRKRLPILTNQEETNDSHDFSVFNVNGKSPNYESPIEMNKIKSNYTKNGTGTKVHKETIKKYLHNHSLERTVINPYTIDSKIETKVKEVKNHKSPCVIDFSNFPSGTFKTIKEFRSPAPLVPFNNLSDNFLIKNKTSIKDTSKKIEVGPFPGIISDKEIGNVQRPSIKINDETKEDPMASHILYLNRESYERANKMLLNQTIKEIGFTLCYKEKFCLLNKPMEQHESSAIGILMRIEYMNNPEEFIFFPSESFKQDNLKKFLLNILVSSYKKICYEAKSFIFYVLGNIDISEKTVSNNWCILDPFVAFWLLDPDHPTKSFDGLLQHISFSKLQKEENWWSECCNYLKYQSSAMGYLHSDLNKLKLWKVFFHLETNIIPILAAMETSSIMVNTDILKKMSIILQEKLNLLEKDSEKMAGHKFSFKSPIQISKVLFEELKLDEGNSISIKNMTRRGNKSTSESMLKLLGNIHPLPNLVLEYRHLWKLKSSYVDTILLHATKNQSVTAKWDLCSTATGRIIATCPNLQAVQKKTIFLELAEKRIEFNLRSCFIAREGFIFVAADFKHIELRMFAHLAKDKILTDWLKREDDVFKLISQARLKKDEITNEDRNQTKTLVYALIYGAGSTKLANILSVEELAVEDIKKSLFGMFPCLRNFRENILNEVRKSKALKSLSGRRRIFPSILSSDPTLRKSTERRAINFIIQGSAADICKITMISIEKKLRSKKINASLLLQIHDELLWEVKNDDYQNMISVLEEVIEENKTRFFNEFQIEIPFPIDVTSGNNWGNMI